MSKKVLELHAPPAGTACSAGRCFHCGEACPDGSFVLEGKAFCCFGCQTVFSILRENGLEQFYQLQSTPGVRVRVASAAAKFKFLDDPAVQEKLYDFSNESQVRVTLHLPAIHCVACVWLLENLFQLHPGIGKSQVNFARREAAITFAPDRIKFSELAALLASIGYEPQLTLGETGKVVPLPARRRVWLQIGLAAFGFGNIMLMSLPVYFGLDSNNGPWFRALSGWLSLAMAFPAVTYGAWDFWQAAWLAVRQRTLTLEVPIVFGLAAIYCTSIIQVVAHQGPGYCDSLTGLILFLLCGRLFQKKTYDRLTFERDYQGFFPLAVTRKTATGEESVAISGLLTGDRIVLRNGELLPADARLVSGEACVDYSFVTGESEPVVFAPGAHLYAGGRQTGGAIEVETIKPVAQSYLASLWNNEAFRKTRDSDVDSQTNRYSRRFTKLVVGLALGSAVFWLFRNPAIALKAFTAVLIVACPCALALAAPLTHGMVQRLLARVHIFLRNALVIERMAEVDTIVLDKTGTLTAADAHGVQFEGRALAPGEVEWIASLARHSTHPHSVRIARCLGAAALPVAHFEETAGGGIGGVVAGNKILLGSLAWVRSLGGRTEETAPGTAAGSLTCVAINGVLRGCFRFENTLRPEVERLIASLGGRYQLALLSGDNEREAARFTKLFGAGATLRFNQQPADKLRFIQELQQRGRKVMMVGDGLNDAGALKQAEVGVAVVEEVGAFSPASDVILDAAELARLAKVLQFSRRAVRIVRTGFVISALYNLLGVTIAAAGLMQPIVCAILMPISSVTVVSFACSATTWQARRLGFMATAGPRTVTASPGVRQFPVAAAEPLAAGRAQPS